MPACLCSSNGVSGKLQQIPGSILNQHCSIIITLKGKIEIDNFCRLYSIGNQNISGSISTDCSQCLGCDATNPTSSGDCCNTCKEAVLYINAKPNNADVCDGDPITVSIFCGQGSQGYIINPYAYCCLNVTPLGIVASLGNNMTLKIDRRKLINLVSKGTRKVNRI